MVGDGSVMGICMYAEAEKAERWRSVHVFSWVRNTHARTGHVSSHFRPLRTKNTEY